MRFKRFLTNSCLLLLIFLPASRGFSRRIGQQWPDSGTSRPAGKSTGTPPTARAAQSIATYPVYDWPVEYPLHNGILLGSYYDDDPTSPGYRDYSSGSHTYDGHNGTDFDLHDFRSMDRGVAVLAAADGVVDSAQYSIFDRNTQFPRNDTPNDILVRHDGGSYSWYIHLRKNSITVAPGENVRRGQVIGMVGSSGSSTLPHLHFETGEFIGNTWTPRDTFQGPSQPLSSLWKGQEPYVAAVPLRVADLGVFTRDAAGGNMNNISDSALKERLTQPAVFGASEPAIGVWVLYQGRRGQGYTVELLRPDGSLFNSTAYTLTDYALQNWSYFSWNFAGRITASDYGTWSARVTAGGSTPVQTNFEVGPVTVYAPRFSNASGRSLRITGRPQQEQLAVSPLGGPVTYSLLNAPAAVSLQGSSLTIDATSSQPYRSAYFQVIATDAAGRQDSMWYHLVDPSKPFANDSIRALLDKPLDGNTASGQLEIRGWSAIAGGGRARKPGRVDLFVDDRFAVQLSTGVPRPDVQRVLAGEGYTAAGDLGFSGTWNSSQVAEGPHKLMIRAGDADEGRFEFVTESTVNVVVARNTGSSTSTAFDIGDRAGFSAVTTNNNGSPTVGYARIQTQTGSTAPSGFSIFNLRQNNILVTEASVPEAQAMMSGRLYAEINGPVNTGVAIANPSAQPASISFQFVDVSGIAVRETSLTVSPGGQFAAFLDQSPFNSGNFTGALTFSSSVPVSVIALRGNTNQRSEFLITTLPVVSIAITTADTLIVPHLASGGGWRTQIVLVNGSSQPESGTLEFFTQGTPAEAGSPWNVIVDSQSTNTLNYTVPARAGRAFKLSGAAVLTAVGWARIRPSAGQSSPAGAAVFSYEPAGVTVSETSVAAVPAASSFRMYVESSGGFDASLPGSIESGLAIASSSSTPLTVSYEMTKLDGAPTGLSGSLTIPATGQIASFLRQLPGLTSMQRPFQGILRLSSSGAFATVGLRGRYNERSDFLLATTPPSSENNGATAQELFFPHLVFAGGYTTQFVLFSGTSNASSGTLTFFSQAGQPLSVPIQR